MSTSLYVSCQVTAFLISRISGCSIANTSGWSSIVSLEFLDEKSGTLGMWRKSGRLGNLVEADRLIDRFSEPIIFGFGVCKFDLRL